METNSMFFEKDKISEELLDKEIKCATVGELKYLLEQLPAEAGLESVRVYISDIGNGYCQIYLYGFE